MTRNNIFPLIFMLGLSVMPVIFIHMPRTLSFLPLLFGLVMSIWWVLGKKERITHYPKYLYCLIAVSFLCIISVLWSIEPKSAYNQAIKVSAILLFSVPLFNLAKSLKIEPFKPFLWIFPVGIILAALLASFELALNMPIYRATHSFNCYQFVSSAVLNRGVVSTTLLYFISILFINNMDGGKIFKYALMAITTLSVIMMLVLTQCQSAQMAFVAGVIIMLALPHRHKCSYKLLAIVLALVMFATPFIVDLLFIYLMDNAQEIAWLKDGYAGPRVEIWNFVMEYALNNPLYGYGIEATRFIKEFEHDYIYHKGPTILHPHNFSIQIWIDFGIIGIAAASALIAFTINEISKLALSDRKVIISLLIATIAVSSTGYGLWQSWWIGEFMLMIALCAFIAKDKK